MLLFVVAAVTLVSACGKKDERWEPTRKYHMFNLATTFGNPYDPYYNNHSDFYNEWQNSNQLRDPFIDYLIEKMRELEPDQKEEYLEYWEEFIVQMNRMMVVIPLYSNQLHDFYNEAMYAVGLPASDDNDYLDANETAVKLVNSTDQAGDGNLLPNTPFWLWYYGAARLRIDQSTLTDTSNPRNTSSNRDTTNLGTQLNIGSVKMAGNFYTGFGNSAYDNQIRQAVGGYATYALTPAGEFVLNPTVVKEVVKSDYTDADGKVTKDATYTFTLHEDLYTNLITGRDSNGRANAFEKYQITAKDYIYSIMFTASKAMADAGSTDTSYSQLLGYADYNDGTKTTFDGVQYIDTFKFSVTIDPSELPYFFKDSIASVAPIPAKEYFPNYAVTDTFTKAQAEAVVEEYLNKPVFAGPYIIDTVNDEITEVRLIKNAVWKGDFQGFKPEIDTILVMEVPNATDMDMLIAGDIDYLEHQVEGPKIEAAKDNLSFIDYTTRNRNGYGYLGFHVDMPIVDDYRVRQAITYLIDRESFIDEFLGGYGMVVHGPYGVAQWMVEESDIVPEKLIQYEYDVDKAADLLDSAGWRYGKKDGRTIFDPEKHSVRYNRLGEPLELYWGAQEDSEFSNLLLPILMVGFEEAGIKLNVDYLDWNGLLDNFYYVVNEMEEDPTVGTEE